MAQVEEGRGRMTRLARSRFGLVAIAAVPALALALVTRLVLLGMARGEIAAPIGAVLRGLVVGEIYDVVVVGWLMAPLVLYLALTTERWYHRPTNRGLVRALLWFGAALGVFVAVAEVLFFDEFRGRFNFVAVDYLIYPTEVATNLWESYPLVWIFGGIGVAAVAFVWLMRRRLAATFATTTPGRARATVAVVYGLTLGALTVAVGPGLARVSDDRTMNEIAANGYYTFWGALLGQDAPYEGWYAVDSTPAEQSRLAGLLAEPELAPASLDPHSTLRHIEVPGPERRLNVVMVLEESLGSTLVGALHPRDTSLTPHFDSLMALGTLLTNAYSTGNRTIRALEATSASIPPLPGISIVRRTASHNLFTLAEVLRSRGYATMFIYGGRALFDGMGSYMRDNGMERVIEQKDYPDSVFRTAWGVADEYIFDKSLTEMDSLARTGQPFYSLILSVSNHKPYSYPAGRIAADPNARRRVNAVQYADWALARFMTQAQTHPWYGNTLFVLLGDHGARVYGASEIPLPSYEVPILFVGPGIGTGQRLATLTSSLDLPPTILARLGVPYDTRWYGHDVFSIPPSEGRALMTHNSEIALMRGDTLAVLGLKGQTDVYLYDHEEGRLRLVKTPSDAERSLVHDAIAYYHTADRLYRSGEYHFPAQRVMAGK